VCILCLHCRAAAAGHLSSRPENASSKSVLFFRSVAAISFSSETRRRAEDYASLLLITYIICLAEHDRTVKTTTKRVYTPLAPGLIYCRLPPTHHSSSVGRSCVSIICLLYYCRHYNMCIVSLADCRVRVPTIVKRMDLVVYIQKRRVCRRFALCIYISRTKWNNTHTYAISTTGGCIG